MEDCAPAVTDQLILPINRVCESIVPYPECQTRKCPRIMAPTRPLKRQKTNPDEAAAPATKPEALKPEQIPLPPDSRVPSTASEASFKSPESKRNSWYPSWSRKTAPIATATRDSATSLHDGNAETASIMSDRSTPRRPSTRSASLAMTLGKASSNRSLPVDATTSKVNATSDARSPSRTNSMQIESDKGKEVSGKDPLKQVKESKPGQQPEQSPSEAKAAEKKQDATNAAGSIRQSGWFQWLAKDDSPAPDQNNAASDGKAGSTAANKNDPPKTNATIEPDQAKAGPATEHTVPTVVEDPSNQPPVSSQKKSWYQMLGGDSLKPTTTATTSANAEQINAQDTKATKSLEIPIPATPNKSSSQASSVETSPPPPLPGDASKSAGWVFWSREKKSQTIAPTSDQPHEGEIAISNTPSQNKPKRASISIPDEQRPPGKDLKAAAASSSRKPDKKAEQAGSIKSVDRPQTPTETKTTKAPEGKPTKKIESKNAAATALEQPSPRPASPAPFKQAQDNLLLPAFHDTLHLHQSPTLLEQLSRLLYFTKEPELKHLDLVKDPPRIKNALAIGVHGYFPGAMVRTLLGQPTGTSIKFADMAAKSIRKWTNSRGYDCQVKTAALEGEGKISERVELLWKLLLNWIDEIRKSKSQSEVHRKHIF